MWENLYKITKKMKKELVSICITTYNRSTKLQNTLNSVIIQTYKNIEILIIDDFSTDNTNKVIKKYLKNDNRIKYIRHKKNQGLAVARNTAIKNSKGKYFTFIDDDDEWENNYVESFMNIVNNYDVNWCFCCGRKYIRKNKIFIVYSNFNGKLIDYVKKGYTPPVSSQFYFLKTLKKINGYNEKIKSGVDHDLWIKLAINNINIKSIKKGLCRPNNNPKDKRITTNFKKRLFNIKKSLEIWKKDIELNFSKHFYRQFYKNYICYIHEIFILKNIKERNILKFIILIIINPYKIILLKKIIMRIIYKIKYSHKQIKIERPGL